MAVCKQALEGIQKYAHPYLFIVREESSERVINGRGLAWRAASYLRLKHTATPAVSIHSPHINSFLPMFVHIISFTFAPFFGSGLNAQSLPPMYRNYEAATATVRSSNICDQTTVCRVSTLSFSN